MGPCSEFPFVVQQSKHPKIVFSFEIMVGSKKSGKSTKIAAINLDDNADEATPQILNQGPGESPRPFVTRDELNVVVNGLNEKMDNTAKMIMERFDVLTNSQANLLQSNAVGNADEKEDSSAFRS